MRASLLAVTLITALSAVPANAQTLLQTLPDDVLMYWRGGNTMESIKSFGSETGLFKDGAAFESMITTAVDEGLAQATEAMGIEGASLSSWLRSITQTEVALFNVTVDDEAPSFDFVLALETPQAEAIQKFVDNLLEQSQMGFKGEDGNTEIDTPAQTLMFGRKGDLLVLAGNNGRLRSTMRAFGSGAAGGLASSKRFKDAVGSADAKLGTMYMRIDKVLEVIENEMPRGTRRMAGRIMKSLGVYSLRDMGYREGTQKSRLVLTSEGEMPLMDMVSAPVSDAATLRSLPLDTIFAYTWNGLPESFWKKGTDLFLDAKKFPFAPIAQEALRSVQKNLGFQFADLAKHLDIGMTVGFVPAEDGDVDDDDGWFLMSRVRDEDALLEMARTALGAEAKRKGWILEENQDGLWTRFRVTEEVEEGEEMSWRVRNMPWINVGNGMLIVGPEDSTRKLQATMNGKYPTLAKGGGLKGLKSRASAYLYVGIGAISRLGMRLGDDDNPFKGDAAIALAMDLSENRIEINSRQPIMSGLFMMPMMFMSSRVSRVEAEGVSLDEVQRERAVKAEAEARQASEEARKAREEREKLREKKKQQQGGGNAEPPAPAEPVRPGGGGGR